MKNELVEYHQDQREGLAEMLSKPPLHEHIKIGLQRELDFHSRAVAWLESLDEGLAISAAAEKQIQRENLERLNKQVNG